jgi:hypothetical protein
MKGLAITIFLAVLEISAFSLTTGGSLLTDGPEQIGSIRRHDEGIQSEVIVDAERPEIAAFERPADAGQLI